MILVSDMQSLAHERLLDAEALNQSSRLDACFYLCGYCVEIALKARICQTLAWAGFPETADEFQFYRSFQTHDLRVLLHLSGVEPAIKIHHLTAWSIMAEWNPGFRYRRSGTLNSQDVTEMLSAARELMGVL